MACDDSCRLQFDSANHYGSGSAYNLQTILSNDSWMTFRNYNTKAGSSTFTDNVLKTEWISLTGGNYYRIRGQHQNDQGDSHFTVSLEVKDAYTQGHT